MASLDLELVRHALRVAREHGFAEVDLEVQDESFRARLNPEARRLERTAPPAGSTPASDHGPGLRSITSPIVGFYRLGTKPLEVGTRIDHADVVAVVNALGIANEVPA